MTPRQIVKILLPSLLFITTFFPIYITVGDAQAINIYGLIAEMPIAAMVPLLFFVSIACACFGTKWGSRTSAILAIVGIVFAFGVNGSTDDSLPTPLLYTSVAVMLYVLVTPITYIWLFVSGIILRRRKKKELKIKKVPFLVMSPLRLSTLLAISCGFYAPYWMYQNWKAIRTREGVCLSPFWRTAFWIIWIYPLFKRIIKDARSQGYAALCPAGLLASLYICLPIAATVASVFFLSDRWIVAVSFGNLAFGALCFSLVQRAANFSGARLSAVPRRGWDVTLGETMFALFGFGFLVTNAMTLINPDRFGMPSFSEQREYFSKALSLAEEYERCSTALNERYDSLDTTDQAAIDAYNADRDTCEAVRAEQQKVIDDYAR